VRSICKRVSGIVADRSREADEQGGVAHLRVELPEVDKFEFETQKSKSFKKGVDSSWERLEKAEFDWFAVKEGLAELMNRNKSLQRCVRPQKRRIEPLRSVNQ
jgi:hypothetical protein